MKTLFPVVLMFLFACSGQTPPATPENLGGTTSSGSTTGSTHHSTASLSNGGSTGSSNLVDAGGSGSTGGTHQPTYMPVSQAGDCSTIVQQFAQNRTEVTPDGGTYNCYSEDGGYNCPYHDPDYVADFDLPSFDPAQSMLMGVIMCDSACVNGTSGVDGTNSCALQQDFSCQVTPGQPPNQQCQVNGQLGSDGQLQTHSCRPATNYVLDQGHIQVDCGVGANHYQHAYVKYLVLQ